MSSLLIHHVSVVNNDTLQSYNFYNKVLSFDLLMKSVNQEEPEMYHLFFSDTKGNPGTDFTVFPFEGIDKKQFGTNQIERTVFAVPTEDSLTFWENRLEDLGYLTWGIQDYNGSKILRFEDMDGQELAFVPNTDMNSQFYPRVTDEIPVEHVILGIQAVHIRVRYKEATQNVLVDLYGLVSKNEIESEPFPVTVLSLDEETYLNQEIHLIEDRTNPTSVEGIGSINHVALSVEDLDELEKKEDIILEKNYMNSGIKERDFFKAFYFRDGNQIMFEISTKVGNTSKQSYDGLEWDQIPLILPAHLENDRSRIEDNLS